MFDSQHYVPILKWKPAEINAVAMLTIEQKNKMTPLVQFVMPSDKSNDEAKISQKLEKQVGDSPKKIIDAWGSAPIFLDFSLLYPVEIRIKHMKQFLEEGARKGGNFIPTIHIRDDEGLLSLALSISKELNSGFCLRVIRSNLDNLKELNDDIESLIKKNDIDLSMVDLLVDLKDYEGGDSSYKNYFEKSQEIIDIGKWRTFTFSSGSFPKDMTPFKLDEINLVRRMDWQRWKTCLSRNDLKRIPAFSDYTIQFPIYVVTSQFFSPSTTIKYTLEDSWWILKGKKNEYAMYLANAVLLANDSRFSGRSFSYGDRFVGEKADHFDAYSKNPDIKGTGGNPQWLSAGINHHLALVAYQVANLPYKK